MSDFCEYLVPSGPGEAEFVEKRSRFIARVWPVESEAEAQERLAEMREKHWDATHNVYAYIIKNGPIRYSDDGEPSGTSGRPTLYVFQAGAIFNVCCVVTRYYGGILLGAGGLARAYSGAAKMALDAAGVSVVRQWRVVLLDCPYALYEQAKKTLIGHGGVIEASDFGVDVSMEALLPVSVADRCLEDLMELSSGRIAAEVMDTVFRKAAKDKS